LGFPVSRETHTLQSQKRAIAVTQPSIGRRCYGHLNLDTNLLADIDLLHRQRVTLKQPSDHLGRRHGLRFGAPVGHRLLGECPDPRLDADKLGRLAHCR
jgi:hypothetical protein